MKTTAQRVTMAAVALLAAACATKPVDTPSVVEVPQGTTDGQLEFKLAGGNYACDQGVRVGVEREHDGAKNHRVAVNWKGKRHVLERDPSYSGLPRFEDNRSGLVWIDLPWKSVLLDGRTHKPLATECKLS
ncbi:hypothetical protein [Pseudothauera rhizosphaerae]|uniref:Membrane-bound lysozyme-inhibitor of c-type lysozyme n=1 Tax=Pseudothauera rhizosphaerae TaxID=2565932 RepID=A0A4S4AQK5_9RHOO|nr:hypothetical protein [Pseudothauera rhizosphaerae]THF62041.1 hypothetical protein E6O51_07720 [Pseudothauera rhizosphaerae]